MAGGEVLHVPLRIRRGLLRGDEQASIESAVVLIDHMCRDLGLTDLGDTDVLDVGCGVKFTQAFVNRGVPVRRYVGADINREMIDFLRENVDDPRLDHHHFDVHHPSINPDGQPLTEHSELPVGSSGFDLICLFSVFTHLAPDDYVSMLRVLRRYVKPEGRLFYTLYLDELTSGGHGLMDGLARTLGESAVGGIETFRDLDADWPLRWAVYAREFARQLIDDTGWQIVRLADPDVHLQHHFVCAPV